MRNRTYPLMLFCILLGTAALKGAAARPTVYAFRELARIGSMLPEGFLYPRDTIVDCPALGCDKQLVVEHAGDGSIVHLGVSLFSPETKSLINKPVCDFIERKMLELVLHTNRREALATLERDKATLRWNNPAAADTVSYAQMLDCLKAPVKFTLTENPEGFSAVWEALTGGGL